MTVTLREARQRKGYSIRKLAELVPCNKSTIVALEKKEREEGSVCPQNLLLRLRLDELLGTKFTEEGRESDE